MNENQRRAVRRCACAAVRRADRAITQFFDEILAPSHLHTTQFTLLSAIAESEQATMQQLAEIVVMDRTSLTRGLEPLTRQGLVCIERGADRRTRVVRLTQAGEEALAQAFPYWQKAQQRIIHLLGEERFERLLAEASAVVRLLS